MPPAPALPMLPPEHPSTFNLNQLFGGEAWRGKNNFRSVGVSAEPRRRRNRTSDLKPDRRFSKPGRRLSKNLGEERKISDLSMFPSKHVGEETRFQIWKTRSENSLRRSRESHQKALIAIDRTSIISLSSSSPSSSSLSFSQTSSVLTFRPPPSLFSYFERREK
ncbi:hypothetical protein NE237_031330 [Protea cynaroides]|uniref:Uncharacterized protein n=1 Tax=Protea cynaroides TaxID=273540 RepID=A0A9Q0L124_9MAGN|nr:hypothetical protein NE237_031330 [Protea cynaroides]